MQNGGDFFDKAAARLGLGYVPQSGPPGSLAARGFAKHQEALKDLPRDYKEPDNYPTLAAWLEANPSPRTWARNKARELMAESKAFRDLGMDLGEATHWLAELAHKWKRMAEKQMADQLPDSIGGNSGLTPQEVVASLQGIDAALVRPDRDAS